MQLKNKWGLHLQSCYFNLKSSKQKVKYHIVDNQVEHYTTTPPAHQQMKLVYMQLIHIEEIY